MQGRAFLEGVLVQGHENQEHRSADQEADGKSGR